MKQITKIAYVILIIAIIMTMMTMNVSAAVTKGGITSITFDSASVTMDFGDEPYSIDVKLETKSYNSGVESNQDEICEYSLEDPESSNENVATATLGGTTESSELIIIGVGKDTAEISVTATPKGDEEKFGKPKTVKLSVTVKEAVTVQTEYTDEYDEYALEYVTQLVGNMGTDGKTPTAGKDARLVIDYASELAFVVYDEDEDQDFEIGAYTLDGKKWTAISIGEDPVSISKLLDKGGANVMFTQSVGGKPVAPAAESEIWKVGKINARPKPDKLTVTYGMINDKRKDGDGGTMEKGSWYITGTGIGWETKNNQGRDGHVLKLLLQMPK